MPPAQRKQGQPDFEASAARLRQFYEQILDSSRTADKVSSAYVAAA